jgi:phosphinothricin acetyltransferase
VLVRSATERDLQGLTEIYNHYVRHSHATFDDQPFTVEQRRSWLAHYADNGPYRLLVGEGDDGTLLGYASSSAFRPKPCYRSTVETTVYLHPYHVGRGYGSRLYQALFEELAGEDVHRACAAIALPNDASLALHRRLGFVPVGTFTEVGAKHGRYIDVAWLERPLS